MKARIRFQMRPEGELAQARRPSPERPEKGPLKGSFSPPKQRVVFARQKTVETERKTILERADESEPEPGGKPQPPKRWSFGRG